MALPDVANATTLQNSANFKHTDCRLAALMLLLESHLREQECTHAHYCFNRVLSIHCPLQVLSIMHDKMDHFKIASACFASKTKSLEAPCFGHGHGDKKYSHYALDLYVADSNQTDGSIAKLLRDLEKPSKSSNPTSLFEGTGSIKLYIAIQVGSIDCNCSIP